ncbi:MAG: hypothetical protein ACRDHN_02215, partial [Thermomicrobiales bacterium]
KYRVEVTSKRFPTMVSLSDQQEKSLAQSKQGDKAAIDFTPNETAVYRVRAIAVNPFDRGAYTIKITEIP